MRHRRPGGVPGKPGEGGAVCPCPASSSHSSLAASMEEEEVVEAELLGLPQRQGGLGAEEEASGVGGWGGGGGEGKTVVPHSPPMMAAGWTWPLWSPWGCYSAPRSCAGCRLQTGPPPVRRGPTRSSSTSPGRGHSYARWSNPAMPQSPRLQRSLPRCHQPWLSIVCLWRALFLWKL